MIRARMVVAEAQKRVTPIKAPARRDDNYIGGHTGADAGCRRWRRAPMVSQMARAIHSARVKWPGKAGTSFIRRRSKETQIPRAVMMRVTMMNV